MNYRIICTLSTLVIYQTLFAVPEFAKISQKQGFMLEALPTAQQFPDLVMNFSGFLRNDALISSRQMLETAGANINSTWPMQSAPTTPDNPNGDSLSHPWASLVNILPSINISLGGIKMLGAEVGLFGSTTFVGFDLGNGAAVLSNAFIQGSWENSSIAVGSMPHPLMQLSCFPNVVENEFGTPITPFSLASQIRYQHAFGPLNINLSIFSQYAFPSNGPLTFPYQFLNYYQRNSPAPGIYAAAEYKIANIMVGGGIAAYRLRPRLFTTPKNGLVPAPEKAVVAQGEHIASHTWTAYAQLDTPHARINTQFLYGQNGTPWTNLGGYGVASINASNDLRTYTNIGYYSYWIDINIHEDGDSWFQPGIYAGYTKNRGSQQPIVFDGSTGLPLVYTLDGLVDYIREAYGDLPTKYLMSLFRVSPRLWVYLSKHMALGLECTIFRTQYAGSVDQYFKPVTKENIVSFLGTASLQYLF